MSKSRYPEETAKLMVRLSAYAVNNVKNGSNAFPGHPKNCAGFSYKRIAADLKIPRSKLRHPDIQAHLERLRQQHGLQDFRLTQVEQAIALLQATYASAPVPGKGTGYHEGRIATELKIAAPILKNPDVKKVLFELMHRNGVVDDRADTARDLATLDEYERRLVATGAKVPCSRSFESPDYRRIGEGLGITVDRLRAYALKNRLLAIVEGVGLEPTVTLDGDIAKLKAFVDAAIASGRKAPAMHRSTGYTHLSRITGIAHGRLANNSIMKAEICRWIEACGQEAGEQARYRHNAPVT